MEHLVAQLGVVDGCKREEDGRHLLDDEFGVDFEVSTTRGVLLFRVWVLLFGLL